ncbi:hypothetical protein FRC03_005370 [Tulasnella sp. 419]|nr:hypothetical protein FRC03_005370 [Tulasnella sp. 419]
MPTAYIGWVYIGRSKDPLRALVKCSTKRKRYTLSGGTDMGVQQQMGILLFREGKLDSARSLLEVSKVEFDEMRCPFPSATCLGHLVDISIAEGKYSDARAELDKAWEALRDRDEEHTDFWLRKLLDEVSLRLRNKDGEALKRSSQDRVQLAEDDV